MTAEIINLRQVRKAKEREEKERQASENRRKYGLTKEERERIEAERALADKRMDGLKRGEALDDASDDLDPGNVS